MLFRARNGPEKVAEYERRFAEIAGTRHAISFAAGRMALYAILEAIRIGPGDEVIIPAFTCVVVPNAILYRGARPVYVDIEARTFNIDVTKIEAAITSRTRALYAQHTFGACCDIQTIRAIADRHGLAVIEDAALALGSSTAGGLAGSLGDAALFSTDRTKTISTHLGGMATTNDPDLATRIRDIQTRSGSLSRSIVRRMLLSLIAERVFLSVPLAWVGVVVLRVFTKLGLLFSFGDELQTSKPTAYPYPSRLAPELAVIGIRQTKQYPINAQFRRLVSAEFEKRFEWYADRRSSFADWVLLRYSFLVADRRIVERRLENRWDLSVWFTSVVQCRDSELDRVGYAEGSCPVAEYVTQHIVNFPTHPRVPLPAVRQLIAEHGTWLKQQLAHTPGTSNTLTS